jgi:hypothetical protein
MPAKLYAAYFYGDPEAEGLLRKGVPGNNYKESFEDLVKIYHEYLKAKLSGREVVFSVWDGSLRMCYLGPNPEDHGKTNPKFLARLDRAVKKLS